MPPRNQVPACPVARTNSGGKGSLFEPVPGSRRARRSHGARRRTASASRLRLFGALHRLSLVLKMREIHKSLFAGHVSRNESGGTLAGAGGSIMSSEVEWRCREDVHWGFARSERSVLALATARWGRLPVSGHFGLKGRSFDVPQDRSQYEGLLVRLSGADSRLDDCAAITMQSREGRSVSFLEEARPRGVCARLAADIPLSVQSCGPTVNQRGW
jgi:hypothetical protein